ncbi:Pterin-4-alpha-carbinolamine dehydratase [Serinicoccus hydrothermalis]|uniref:Pterin-4-alpha-carbinolamine dehydratase n=1 Tax=Serinicoccus hydrothermalis TaxID=1758689 RepID=A0A1B1NAD4_9MICO|nr:VOC family protein [Serinicoccus hydrothermalis]ANS78354.1 Pterin-4-alpha-carbinolamine dehydratase [Serinicoccus hydrothermalis]
MDARAGRLTTQEFQAAEGTEDWRGLGRGAHAWFATGSHADGAALVRSVVSTCGDLGTGLPDLDLRATGLRMRLAASGEGFTTQTVELARAISASARDLGLTAQPEVVQEVQLAVDTQDPGAVMDFWETALGYERQGEEDVVDAGRRHPPLWFQDMDAARPLRSRLHLDSVTSQPVAAATVDRLEAAGAGVARHGYYATVADPEGNEVDVLPLPEGACLWEEGTEDWRLVFAAVAAYPVRSVDDLLALVTGAADLADGAGLPLGIDVRPLPAPGTTAPDADAGTHRLALVTVHTAKDRWEMDEGYLDLARQVQQLARSLDLTADPGRARFVQIGLDAADIPAVSTFWQAALGYEPDPRDNVTDIVDPRGLGPVLFFQPIDEQDEQRRAQRNRLHVDVYLPHDVAATRVETAVAAGGTVVRDAAPFWWTVADPEGNEVDLAVTVGREEEWG